MMYQKLLAGADLSLNDLLTVLSEVHAGMDNVANALDDLSRQTILPNCDLPTLTKNIDTIQENVELLLYINTTLAPILCAKLEKMGVNPNG